MRVSERRRPPQIKIIDDVDFVPGASTSSCSDSRVAAAPRSGCLCAFSCTCARKRRADAAKEARGSLRSHDSSTRDRFSSRVDGHGRTGAARPLQRRAAPATGRARSHGGFVDSRAVRRRKRVSRRSPEARGSRGWGDARYVSLFPSARPAPRSRGRLLQG